MLAPTLLVMLLQPGVEGPAPLPPPAGSTQAPPDAQTAEWHKQGRRIKLHAGLSWGFAGAMLLTGTLLLAIPEPCGTFNDVCGAPPARVAAGAVVFSLSTIPLAAGIVWGVRLSQHSRYTPVATLRPRVGGFVLNF